jgi:hypothetical protein
MSDLMFLMILILAVILLGMMVPAIFLRKSEGAVE